MPGCAQLVTLALEAFGTRWEIKFRCEKRTTEQRTCGRTSSCHVWRSTVRGREKRWSLYREVSPRQASPPSSTSVQLLSPRRGLRREIPRAFSQECFQDYYWKEKIEVLISTSSPRKCRSTPMQLPSFLMESECFDRGSKGVAN